MQVVHRDRAARFGRWLATELAATIAGNKPATVLTFVDTPFQETLSLWREDGEELLAGTLISYITLRWLPERETVMFYRADTLKKCLAKRRHADFLRQMGYPVFKGIGMCLEVMQRRFQSGCPHEVGVFLGIPIKDVLGFMGMEKSPLTCRGDWCVYGDPRESLAAMERFAADRACVSRLLAHGTPAVQVFRGRTPLRRAAV